MGFFGQVGTDTVCPYPYTFDDDAWAALAQNASLDFGVERCAQTFAQRWDPVWAVSQGLLGGLAAFVVLPILLHRLWRLWHYTRASGHAFLAMVQTKLYLVAAVTTLWFCLLMIDPMGARDIVSPYVALLADELVAAGACVIAVVIIEFWAAVAKGGPAGVHGLGRGLPLPALVFFGTAPYVLLFGFQIVGMADGARYGLWSGIKQLLAGAVLIALGVVAWRNVTRIERFLTSMQAYRAGGGSKTSKGSKSSKDDERDSSDPQDSTSGRPSFITRLKRMPSAATNDSSVPTADRIVTQLKRKYRQFFALLAAACMILFINGILQLVTNPDFSFRADDTELVAITIVQKTIYLAAVTAVLIFFKVPRVATLTMHSSSRTGQNAGSSSFLGGGAQERGTSVTHEDL